MFGFKRFALSPPSLLEAPDTAEAYLVYRPDTAADGVPFGTSLAVGDEEYALICTAGRIINMLGPGIYVLDLEQLADLAALYSWPGDYHGATNAEVVFVSAAPGHRHIWHSPRHQPLATADQNVSIEMSGTLDFSITDCRRFAHARIESARFTDHDVYRSLDRLILKECRKLLMDEHWPTERLISGKAAFARALSERVDAPFRKQGFGDLRLKIRNIEVRQIPAQTTEETASIDDATGNVHPLPRVEAGAQAEMDTTVPAAPVPGLEDVAELETVISEFEAEIREIDARRGTGRGSPDRPPIDGSPMKAREDSLRTVQPSSSLADRDYYIAVDMEQTGPFSADQLTRAIDDGVVSARTLIWHQGLEDWALAADIPEIENLLRRTGQ